MDKKITDILSTIPGQYIKARLEQFRIGVGYMRLRRTVYETKPNKGYIMHKGHQVPVTYRTSNGWSVDTTWSTPQLSLFEVQS